MTSGAKMQLLAAPVMEFTDNRRCR